MKRAYLDAEGKVEYGVGGVGVAVRLLHLLHEHAQREVELVRPASKSTQHQAAFSQPFNAGPRLP